MAPAVQGLDKDRAQPAGKARRMLDAIGGRWWNVYIGGPESGGHGWTPGLVREYVNHGIDRFMLTYVGRQSHGPLTHDQGEADAHDALQTARTFGYTGSFPLCLDVEQRTFDSAPSAAINYASAWCATVRALGARPGIYANPGPLTAMHGHVPADFVWVASWVSHVADQHEPRAAPHMPAAFWPNPGQRAWQYAGAFNKKPCRVLGTDVDISVADLDCLAHPPGFQIGHAAVAHVSAPAVAHVPPVAGAHVPAAPAAGLHLVRRGDKGEAVVQLTRRLAYVRSERTGRPYLEGARSRLDGEVEAALKAFQAEHRLGVDGVYGPTSAHALTRAVRLEQARRRSARPAAPSKAAASPAASPGGPARLAALVDEVRRLDAETDRAWRTLAAYGRMRTQALAQARARNVSLGDVVTVLLRMEDELKALADIERHAPTIAPEPATTQTPVPAPQPATVAAGVAASQAAGAAVAPGTASQPGPTPVPAEAAAALSSPAGNGGAPPLPNHPRPTLGGLTDEQLLSRIDRLDQALDTSRAVLIARFAQAEKSLALLAPAQPAKAPPGQPGNGSVSAQPTQPGLVQPKRPPAHSAPQPKGPPTQSAGAPAPAAARIPATPDVRNLQRALNQFSRRFLKGMTPLVVDGKKGRLTKQRIRAVRYYLGYTGPAGKSTLVDADFVRRLRNPRSARFSNPAMLARAAGRRRAQQKAALRSVAPRAGVAMFDGKPVAAWIKPYLDWARQHGWHGTLNSGWRDPVHSEQICKEKCHAVRCPGTCAGRSSNHVGRIKPAGAIDITEPAMFAQLMLKCPLSPRLVNALPHDPIHFSVTGH